MKSWKDFNERVARGDWGALNERGKESPVHAARVVRDMTYETACGRTLRVATEFDDASTSTSCRSCLRVLPR